MTRVKVFKNNEAQTIIKSEVKREGERATDQASIHFPPNVNVQTNDKLTYIQDIIELCCLDGFYGFEKSVGDQSGHDNHVRGFINVPSFLSRFEFECNINCTGTGNNNGIMGAGCATFTCGKVGCKAFCFDGVRYITILNECEYDIERDNRFSVALWIKSAAICATQGLVVKSCDLTTGLGWKVFTSSSGKINFTLADGTCAITICGTSCIDDCTFHHVAVTFDGSSNRSGMKLYVDGVLEVTGTSCAISNTIFNNVTVALGAESDGGSVFTGQLDDVYIFKDKELNRDEINALFLRGKTNYVCGKSGQAQNFDGCTTFEIVETDQICPSPSNLVAHYKFENNVLDSKGSNCGTITCSEAYFTGKVGDCAFCFNGSSYISATDSPFDIDHCEPFSYSLWVKPLCTIVDCDVIVGKGNDVVAGIGNYLKFLNTNDRVEFRINDVVCCTFTVTSTTCSAPVCVWTHVGITYSGNSNQNGIKIYINGILDTTGGAKAMVATITNSNNFTIGAESDGGRIYNGQIDDVRFYKSELTAANILQLSKLPFDYERTCKISVSFNYQATTLCVTHPIFTKNCGTGTQGYEILFTNTNDLQIRLINTVTTNELNVETTSAVNCSSCYKQYTITYDGTSLPAGIKIYVCGTSVTTTTVTSNLTSTIRTCNSPLIGNQGSGTGEANGRLDGLRIYNRELSASEASALGTKRNPNYIMKFGGRVTKISKEIDHKEVIAQSFGKALGETEVRPLVYNCKSPEFIVHDLIVNNTEFISVPFPGNSGITITRFTADGKLFDVINDLMRLIGATFYTDGLGNFFCELESFNIVTNKFEHGNGSRVFITKFDDTELVNELTVLGENKRFQSVEQFCGDGTTTTFTLKESPTSTKVEHPVGTELAAEICYNVNSLERTVIFTCAPACGMCNIQISYEFERPFFAKGQDAPSIATNGIHSKRLVMPWIRERADATRFIASYINRFKDPKQNLEIEHPTLVSSLKENDVVQVVNSLKDVDGTFVIKSISWKYPEFVTQINVGEYTFDDFEYDKQITEKLHDLESAITTIRTLQDFEFRQETLNLTDVVTVDVGVQPIECLGMTETFCLTEIFDATYDCACTTYDEDDAYV